MATAICQKYAKTSKDVCWMQWEKISLVLRPLSLLYAQIFILALSSPLHRQTLKQRDSTDVQCIAQHFGLILLLLLLLFAVKVHFITFAIMHFVSFTDSHWPSRCSLRILRSKQKEMKPRSLKWPERCRAERRKENRKTGAATLLTLYLCVCVCDWMCNL